MQSLGKTHNRPARRPRSRIPSFAAGRKEPRIGAGIGPSDPARWQQTPRKQRRRLESGSVTFLIFFAAAAGAGIVAAGLFGGNRLLFLGGAAVTAGELQLGHFLVLLALDIAREIFDSGSRGAALFGARSHQRCLVVVVFVVLLVFIFGRERQHGSRSLRQAARTTAIVSWLAGRTTRRDLQEEQVPDGLVLDPIHHVLEHFEGFFLVLDQRVLLAVAAQADAFLQVVHRQQVVLPLVVDHVEHDHALGGAEQFRTDHFLFFVVFRD